ncbi:MAG TPA: N-acetylmuramoyl-L-alanine amidase [Candidatus Sulfotelmatobacter sp.]
MSPRTLLWCGPIVLVAVLLVAAAPEKRLSVYSTAANYSLPVVQRDRRDYVGLLELLEPLGKVNAKFDGQRWRLRYNNRVEGDFLVGKTRVRIQGHDAELPGRFLLENERGLVPVSSLAQLLPRFLGGPVTVHEDSDRLFVGNIATHFTASLAGDNPPKLVFHFTMPVNPMVSTDQGALHMIFSREPIVAPALPTLTFGSKVIPSATYTESNGGAMITVSSPVPLIASFSADGRTATISPTSPASAQTVVAPPAPAAPSGNAVPPVSSPGSHRYFAVIDASHGGDDRGETLSNSLFEKDVTAALARSLRQELESRGITVLDLRDSDVSLSLDQRAFLANNNRAAVYIALHATAIGHGVRVYTALLPYGGDDRGPFHSWTTSQQPHLALSQSAAADIANEFQKRQIPVRALTAPLRPLNSITTAALAVEVAPQGSDLTQLTAPDYQQLVTSAVATAIAADRDKLGAAQ